MRAFARGGQSEKRRSAVLGAFFSGIGAFALMGDPASSPYLRHHQDQLHVPDPLLIVSRCADAGRQRQVHPIERALSGAVIQAIDLPFVPIERADDIPFSPRRIATARDVAARARRLHPEVCGARLR